MLDEMSKYNFLRHFLMPLNAVQWILNAIHIMLLRFSLHSNTVYSTIVAGKCGVALHFQLNLMQTPVLELHYVQVFFYI